jgi:toxin ParE1/3/4
MADRRRPIIWSPEARADLSEIWDYYARRADRHRADKIVREIGDASRVIEDHPFAGRTREEVRPGLRSITARPYVIFYRMADDVAEIVRVLHGGRDLDDIFAKAPTDN